MINVYNSNTIKDKILYRNGHKILNKCISAIIDEGINSDYTLTLVYPLSDPKSSYLVKGNIIKAPGPKGDEVFRIFKTRKNTRQIECLCKHITYDLDDNFLEDVRPTNVNGTAALSHMIAGLQFPTEFSFFSNITKTNTAYYIRKNFIEAIMGDDENSFFNRWGGELNRQNFRFEILQSLGSDRGFRVQYGKNIIGIEETEEGEPITRIMPVGRDENDNPLLLPEKYIDSPLIGSYPNPKVKPIDFPNIKVSRPDEETEYATKEAVYTELRRQVNLMYSEDNVDRPQINFAVEFKELRKVNKFKNISSLLTLFIGDICTIHSNKLNLDLKARLRKYSWDSIKKKYISYELGDYIKSQYTANAVIRNNIIKIQTENYEIGNKLKSALGGHVVKREGEILIMDTDSIATATKVWRFNLNGLGYSPTGYNGDYGVAITMDGEIVANFIKTGELDATLIKVGVIQSQDGSIIINIENGAFKIGGRSGDIAEITNSFAKFMHSNGSYSRVDADGFYNYIGSTGREYHHLFYSGELTFNGSLLTVTLPDEFKGKNFVINPYFIDSTDTFFIDPTAATTLKWFGINFENNTTYINYTNATFSIFAYSAFVTDSGGSKSLVNGKPKIGFIATA